MAILPGQKILLSDLQALATLAGQKLGREFRFLGPWRVVRSVDDLVTLKDVAIGDIAIVRGGGAGDGNRQAHVLQAHPSTEQTNWPAMPLSDLLPIDHGPYEPYAGSNNMLLDLQQYDFVWPDQGLLTRLDPLVTIYGGSLSALWSRGLYIYRDGRFVPLGHWIHELNRIRHWLYARWTIRTAPQTEDFALANYGLKPDARVSGPWPITLSSFGPNTPYSLIDWYAIEDPIRWVRADQGSAARIILQAEAASQNTYKARYAVQAISYARVLNEAFDTPIGHVGRWWSGAQFETAAPGRIVGTVFCFIAPNILDDSGLLRVGIGIEGSNPEVVKSFALITGGWLDSVAAPGHSYVILRLDIDGEFPGGQFRILIRVSGNSVNTVPTLPGEGKFLGADGELLADGTSYPVVPIGLQDADILNVGTAASVKIRNSDLSTSDLPRHLIFNAQEYAGTPFTFYVERSCAPLVFPGPGPVRALCRQVGHYADITADAIAHPLQAEDGRSEAGENPYPWQGPNENIGRILIGLKPDDRIVSAILIAKTVPPRAIEFLERYNNAFAPDAGPGGAWTDPDPLVGGDYYVPINLAMQPYPCESRDQAGGTPPASIPLTPILGAGHEDDRLFMGMITEITASRMPSTSGKNAGAGDIDSSAKLSVGLYAYGIHGNEAGTLTRVWYDDIPAGQQAKTWYVQRKEFTGETFIGIPVLTNYKLISTPANVLVQCRFIPSLSNYAFSIAGQSQQRFDYSGVIDEDYIPASVAAGQAGLQYVTLPVFASHFNDTEALLKNL